MKCIKVPGCLTESPFHNNALTLNGLSVVESCTHTHKKTGSMFLEEHLLLFVKKGTNTMTHGKTQHIIRSGEMLLLKKATLVNYCKEGDPAQDNVYDSMMFFLKDEFLKDFMKMANIQSSYTEEQVKITVKPVKERLLRFFDSITPYFTEPENIDAGLIKLKMLELLYDISGTDKNLLQQILQLKQPVKTELTTLMEEQFTNPVSLSELAYLSGRSLSSFKRDFQSTYNMPPSEWIRNRRLEKANELLKSTSLTVTDICYTMGFENIAHFSRVFKERFGYTPSSLRQKEPVPLS
jgi:AraC-like DNA-binding protein